MADALHVVGIQADLVWENPTKNLAFFEEKIGNLPKNTDLVVLPEMFTTGFTMNPKNVAESMDGITVSWMLKMATKNDIAICGSLVISDAGNFYNRLVFVHPSGNVEIYDKRHSFTLAGEDKVYKSGNKRLLVNYKGWKICPFICYDLRFPVWTRNNDNYDLLIFVANWPLKRIKAWDLLLKATSVENISYTIGVNRVGKDLEGLEYSGNSLILDYLGDEVSSLGDNVVGIVSATLFKSEQNKTRKSLGFLNDMDSFVVNV